MLMLVLMVVRPLWRRLAIAIARYSMRLGRIIVVWLWALRVMRLGGSVCSHWYHYRRISDFAENIGKTCSLLCGGCC